MTQGIPVKGLKPAAVLGANKPHGTRVKYVGGCRCRPCTAANTAYEVQRYRARKLKDDFNGIVSAERAREHLKKLARAGLGRRAIAQAAGVNEGTIQQIRNGKRTQLRARSERKILAVTPEHRAGGALVSAKRTWQLIGLLLEEGYTQTYLAKRLGYKGAGLQFSRDQVTARIARRVAKLYEVLTT